MAATATYDAIVLGLGAMGSAALHALASRGIKACGIDQHHVPNDRGSSHGAVRIIRKAYFEHPDYIPLLLRSYELWDALQSELDEPVLVRNGLVLAGAPDSETILGLNACYAEHDIPHESLSAAQSRERFPFFHVPDGQVVSYDPDGGYVKVEAAMTGYLRKAQALGAELRIHDRVQDWSADGDGIVVTTDKDILHAKKLIITIGPWAARALKEWKIPLEVLRKVQLWYDSPNIESCAAPECPCFAAETADGFFYGFPDIDGAGLKAGEHTGGQIVNDADEIERGFRPDEDRRVLQFLETYFPYLEPSMKHFEVCMYTNTPDGHFILDHLPSNKNVVFAAGLSGHGFKFAPVIGEILADLAIEDHTVHPIGFLRLDRLLND